MAVLLCLSLAGGPAAGDGGEPTYNADTTITGGLSGTWTVESIEFMGMKINPPGAQQMTLTFNNGKAVMNDGMRREETTYKLDDSQRPKAIDLFEPKGQANQAIKGIYKIEGNRLTIAFPVNGPGVARPAAFDAKDCGIMILKRIK
jgi:uncharacterized protein (TIGR03067 family)